MSICNLDQGVRSAKSFLSSTGGLAQSRSTSASWPTLWAASSLSTREGSATTYASDGIRYVVCSLVLVFGMQQRLISFLMLTLFVVLVALPTKCPTPTLHTLAQGTPTPPHLLHLPLLWHQHQLRYQHPLCQQNPTKSNHGHGGRTHKHPLPSVARHITPPLTTSGGLASLTLHRLTSPLTNSFVPEEDSEDEEEGSEDGDGVSSSERYTHTSGSHTHTQHC